MKNFNQTDVVKQKYKGRLVKVVYDLNHKDTLLLELTLKNLINFFNSHS